MCLCHRSPAGKSFELNGRCCAPIMIGGENMLRWVRSVQLEVAELHQAESVPDEARIVRHRHTRIHVHLQN